MPFLLFVQSIAAIGKVPNRVVDNCTGAAVFFKREPGGGLAAHGMSAGERLRGRNPTKPFSLPDETILGSAWRRPERITGQDSDHRSTTEFDHLGTHKFDLSGTLQGAFAGDAKASPQR
jgi:hypothetical protein